MLIYIRPLKGTKGGEKNNMNVRKVKAAVVESGYSQTELARDMGISKNTLNLKLNGHSDFTTSEMWKICQILKIPKERIIEIFLP